MLRVAMLSMHTCPLAKLGGEVTGGMNVHVRELARALGRLGVGVDVFTRTQAEHLAREVPFGELARVVHIEAGPRAPRHKDDLYPLVPRFARGVRHFADAQGVRYDLVHAHYWLSGLAGAELAEAWEVPLLLRFHTLAKLKNLALDGREGGETALRVLQERQLMRRAEGLEAATPSDRAHMVLHYGAPPDMVRLVPCGVDLELFRPLPRAAARAELGLREGRVVLFVGRVEPIKGLDDLIRALASLRAQRESLLEDLVVLVVGGRLTEEKGAGATAAQSPEAFAPGPQRAEVARLCDLSRQLGVEGWVRFLGSRDQALLPLYYAAADLCVLPSRYESFGMVALEAAACGRPLVASAVGGLSHIVRHGKTGLLVPPGRPEALGVAMGKLLEDERLRAALGRVAWERAQRFGWERAAERTLPLYEDLLAQPAWGKLARRRPAVGALSAGSR
ncbi:MAG: glycosyltransferase [Nitrospinota bacterium]